jgi:hypothetical protein
MKAAADRMNPTCSSCPGETLQMLVKSIQDTLAK